MDKTKEILKKMLTENTGTHMLDSGGTNGRAWQRNQGKDFDKEPESTVEFSTFKGTLEAIVTHSTYHWLAQRCTYNEELDDAFREWVAEVDTASSPGYRERSWLQLMQEWLETREAKGIYGDGEPVTVNTYNGEDCLSQTLQFVYWEDEEGRHILLQIHGGADVRGGYTVPRVFDASVDEGIFDNAQCTLYCNNKDCSAGWYSDDGGHHWYPSNAECQLDEVIEFEGENTVVCDRNPRPHEKHGHGPLESGDALCNFPQECGPLHVWEEGKVVVFNNKALCPECGKGELQSGFY
jgi:hypothetical protein